MFAIPTFGESKPARLQSHGTDYEMLFIRHLGRWSAGKTNIPRLELLRRYAHALTKRVRWGDINAEEVQICVQQYIAEEKRA